MRTVESFTDWLTSELDTRGWSRAEAARRGGISASILDKIISGYSQPGDKTCRGLARAFGLTTEEVMRRAGLIPSRGTTDVRDPELRALMVEIADLVHGMTPAQRRYFIDQVRLMRRLIEEDDARAKNPIIIG